MTGNELRKKYLEFFEKRGHKVIPAGPLIPQNDPTTLLTSSGMQPLIPFLLGEPHPEGDRLVNSQPSIRAHGALDDTEEVGDNRHTTFFEMLGNWSLGSYFKNEQLTWIFEFLTNEISISVEKLYVTAFVGDRSNNIPRDTETVEIWKKLFSQNKILAKEVELGSLENASEVGMEDGRIFYYDVKKNWWSRSGTPAEMPSGEPGGPDSEIFYEFTQIKHDPKYGKKCHPNCDCGRFLEIGNSVFMEYLKSEDGTFKLLPKKNVDFGGGFERILSAQSDNPDVFSSDLFVSIISEVEKASGKKYEGDNRTPMRIIADHLKAATFLISQGVTPNNKQQGYILRRFIRRAAVKMHQLRGGLTPLPGFVDICFEVIRTYEDIDLRLGFALDPKRVRPLIEAIIDEELGRFGKTLDKGLRVVQKAEVEKIDGRFAFDIFQTYGFPFEVTKELVGQRGKIISKNEFNEEFKKHQTISRTSSGGMFKGGLADHSEVVTKYHSATHLLHSALRRALGEQVHQEGSNITNERLRFDFSYPTKLTEEEVKKVENLVNEQIKKDLTRKVETMTYQEAIDSGALAFFKERYPEKVMVYSFGLFSREICGGPHIENTGVIGRIKITKVEKIAAGTQRIYATIVS